MHLREVPGPPGAPTVVLLHGWTATADLNFFTCYAALGEHHRVLRVRPPRPRAAASASRRLFRLEDCADDVVAMADALGIDELIAVGYSMGGAVAQLLWRRHPDRVRGLVLAATAAHFNAHRNERLSFLGLSGLAALARLTPAQARRWLTTQLYLQRKTSTWAPWAVEQAAHHDWRMVLEAGRALGTFRSDEWLGDIDVPTAVIVTMADQVVPVRRQIQLFEGITTASAFRVDAGHDGIVARPERFVPVLLQACADVATRDVAAAAMRRRTAALAAGLVLAGGGRRRRATAAGPADRSAARRAPGATSSWPASARPSGRRTPRRRPASCSPPPSAAPSSTTSAGCAAPSRSPSASAT